MGLIIEGLPFNQVWHSPAFSMCNFTSVVPRKNYISHQGWRKVRSNNVTRPGPTWVTKKDPYLKLIQITRPEYRCGIGSVLKKVEILELHLVFQFGPLAIRTCFNPYYWSYGCPRAEFMPDLSRPMQGLGLTWTLVQCFRQPIRNRVGSSLPIKAHSPIKAHAYWRPSSVILLSSIYILQINT